MTVEVQGSVEPILPIGSGVQIDGFRAVAAEPKEAVALGEVLLNLGAMYFELFFTLSPMLFAQYDLHHEYPLTSQTSQKSQLLLLAPLNVVSFYSTGAFPVKYLFLIFNWSLSRCICAY